MTNKVNNKRNANITKAIKEGDWSSVDKLLNQPFENLERKDRKYGVSSLNAVIRTEGGPTEVMDLYADNTFNPIEQLLAKDRNERLYNALSKLSEDDRHIILEMTLNGASALQLTQETKYKSHKTVQSHYQKALELLREEIKNYF